MSEERSDSGCSPTVPERSDLPDFSGGRIVVLYVRNAPASLQNGVILEYVSVKNYGGRIFLEGRVPNITGIEWSENLPGGVAWDQVSHYLVFASREDYSSRQAVSAPGWSERLRALLGMR